MQRSFAMLFGALFALAVTVLAFDAHAYDDPKGKPLTSSERFHLGIGVAGRFDDIRSAKIDTPKKLHYYLTPRVQYDCLKNLSLEARMPLALSRDGKPAFEIGIFLQK